MLTIIALFLLISSIGDDMAYNEAKRAEREERQHKELMAAKKPEHHRITRRRIVQDKDGNTIAEEITEETE